ncbi:nitrogen permease regulator 2 [Daldinia caldariorum]|uniref:nitrogen permease regulator 2 n=1 Tax=Daldinia caldariorum TaxID=326644 RepID=UPI002008A290|nr:nitrogen permease regulator 2 [Daldinia caldariorum]KAI1463180.1 nitrogen permease regulator 2 [Daldinia caldariorum]
MIQGIFYARFLPQEGTKIVAQSPPGCIVATTYTPHLKPPLVDFDIIQEYIIPRKAFFNRFMTVNSPDNKYSVLLFPVSIPSEIYHRNEFIFNFGLVVESDVDHIPYEKLVRRLAVTFAEMERQHGYLSSDGRAGDGIHDDGGRRPIESLLEIVKEDLNNYGECMIPVDDANTLNMKLFPYHPPPPPVRGWHVPVPKMKLADIVDPTWDLTLQKIIPHLDGVNDVRRIAWLADVSLPLTQIALQHLLYYDTILLLDMFFFGSCYAPRPGIHDFVVNRDGIVDECAGYVCLSNPLTGAGGNTTNTTTTTTAAAAAAASGSSVNNASTTINTNTTTSTAGTTEDGHDAAATAADAEAERQRQQQQHPAVSHYQLVKLMTTFCTGRSVMEWIKLHQDAGFDVLRHVDVRRLVQFGVIKGLLYRVHKYVVSKQVLESLATGRRVLPPRRSSSSGDGDEEDALLRYADGCHTFDQIVTEQNMTDGEIMKKLRSLGPGDRTVFYR